MTELDRALRTATAGLTAAGITSARVDAELLAGHVLGLSRGAVQARALGAAQLDEATATRLEELARERARRVPLQHLIGTAPFRTLELRVGPGVFIPRPETESVVGVALDRLNGLHDVQRPRVVDLGTGSGAMAASIAAEFPSAEVHAVEVSVEAAAWAEQNLSPHGVQLHRYDLRQLPSDWEVSFDVVVSNPPYIPPGQVPVDAEVRDHDPHIALYGGGPDGLALPRAVIQTAKRILKPGGWFILEHAEVQATTLHRLCTADPQLDSVRTHQDLAGRDRGTSAIFTGGVE